MSERATLLFVDDEERIVNLLRMIFRDHYNVLVCTSGKAALEVLRTQRVDVIVSDQRMPEMTGTEVLAQAREISPATIRLLLTGYSDLAAIVGSVNDGEVYRFLNKPWNHDDIQSTIADAVAAARLTRSAIAQAQMNKAGPESQLDGLRSAKLLLIDDNVRDLMAMTEVLKVEHDVVVAKSLSEALQALEQHEVGVIITEARVNDSDISAFLRVLKQHYPLITTVMLTRMGDADLVINLINKAQIFRFATKPLMRSSLLMAASAAMKQYLRVKTNPELARRNQVEGSGEVEDQGLVAAVKRSISRWRVKIPFFSTSTR